MQSKKKISQCKGPVAERRQVGLEHCGGGAGWCKGPGAECAVRVVSASLGVAS